jgi:hypothetical protein
MNNVQKADNWALTIVDIVHPFFFDFSYFENDDKRMHIDTRTDGRGVIKCAVEMSSGGMIYIPSFMRSDTGVQAVLSKVLS